MGKQAKLLQKILGGHSDTNIPFEPTCHLLEGMGFKKRSRGTSYVIFTIEGIEGLINMQSKEGKVKPYQVKQIREFLTRYPLMED